LPWKDYGVPSDQHQTISNEISRLVYKHDQDLYFGNGKPGLTTRMLLVENTCKAISYYAKWAVIFLGGILLTALAHLIIVK
jgi:hypothetical protein